MGTTGPQLVELIRRCVIGEDEAITTPFGTRRVVYADYTASGRALTFIEDFIRDAVLPLYANTHTESSGTGLQTTRFREDARATIAAALGANTEEHAVVFCGSGSTGAIDRLVGVLNLRIPADLDARYDLSSGIPADERPVVLIGPFEHHSNELPWRESIADVVTIREDTDGHVDLAHLEAQLALHAHRPLVIGSFSAASNVTGITTDTHAISQLLHEHGALAFWDCAAAGPYVDIEMGSAADGPAYKDAVFLSPHKFIGGPSTPGVLVARRELFTNTVPVVPGGGTVWYVNPDEHRYVDEIERREEGGTPAIVESVRAGLVFKLKEAVGAELIREREEGFIRRAITSWVQNPSIEILGNAEAERLSIVSFVVRTPEDIPGAVPGGYLHHNLVVALLNDLFGIQSRGGCSCAGPYGHRLLGIDLDRSHAFEREIARGCEGIKPGWVRVNFNYFISETVFDYIVEAVHLVAEHGWRLLRCYDFDPLTGLWRHRGGIVEPPLSLHDVTIGPDGLRYPEHRRIEEPESALARYIEEARQVLAQPPEAGTPPDLAFTEDFESLRWFPLPGTFTSDAEVGT